MIKQKHLVLTSEVYFSKKTISLLFVILLFQFFFLNCYSQEQIKKENNLSSSISKFPIVVIDMKKVLSKANAWKTLQTEMKELEENFKNDISSEESDLKKEQQNLIAQKSVISQEDYKIKEDLFRGKVKKTQTKIENIRRKLESTMAKGMQIIQAEAIKHLKKIAAKEGYLLVLDATSTVIAADKINISDLVAEKLNKTLPKINIERKEDKKVN